MQVLGAQDPCAGSGASLRVDEEQRGRDLVGVTVVTADKDGVAAFGPRVAAKAFAFLPDRPRSSAIL